MILRIIIGVFLFSNTIFGIQPKYSIKADGNVTDLIFENDKLFIATDNGSINVYDVLSKKRLKTYNFPKIKDFIGDLITVKVYDIDKISGKNILLSVSQGLHGFSNVYLIKNGKYEKIISDSENKLMIKKIKFINENRIILGLLSNEIILFDINTKKQVYRKQISPYTFSDIVLSKNKKRIVTADESGIIHVLESNTGKTIKELSGNNVDNVYQIDYKNNIILCGGQDRRLSIYNIETHKSYYINSSFLIYSVGLSPTGQFAGFSCNEENDIKIINSATKETITKLSAHKSTITKILFIDENKLFTSAEENVIYYWEL